MHLECTVFKSEIDNLDLTGLQDGSDETTTLTEKLEESLQAFVKDHDGLETLDMVLSDEDPDMYHYPLGRGRYLEKSYGPSTDAVEVKVVGIPMANGGRIGSMAVPPDRQRNYSLAAAEVVKSVLKPLEGGDA